jgi:hypothetical protein
MVKKNKSPMPGLSKLGIRTANGTKGLRTE